MSTSCFRTHVCMYVCKHPNMTLCNTMYMRLICQRVNFLSQAQTTGVLVLVPVATDAWAKLSGNVKGLQIQS